MNDLWYSSHQPYFSPNYYPGDNSSLNVPNKSFYRDEPASVLGCVIQEQLCNPRLPAHRRCTPLSGNSNTQFSAAKIVESEKEAWALEWQQWALLSQTTNLWDIINVLGSASLAAVYSLYDGVQAHLPDNQWQLDVEYWHSTMLALLQGSAVDVADGPSDPKLQAELYKPRNKRERELCRRQVSQAHI